MRQPFTEKCDLCDSPANNKRQKLSPDDADAVSKTGEAETQEAFDNPRVGDRFTEMFAFYLYVLEVVPNRIVTLEASPPCTLPRDGFIRIQTPDEFRERFAYGNIPGYWVRFLDHDNDVAGWREFAEGGAYEREG